MTLGSRRGEGPLISLITGSLFRAHELERLIRSLCEQTYPKFELIIVEQANVRAAEEILRRFDKLDGRVVRSARGLSRARNCGMACAVGDVIGFPDDDCWYEPETLARVAQRFEDDPSLMILCGRVETTTGPMLRYPAERCEVTRRNVWRTAVSPGIFVRADGAARIGGFDTSLGLGSGTAAGSGEETDYVLRALTMGLRVEYDDGVRIMHPSPEEVADRLSPLVGRSYGQGMAAVLRLHRYGPMSIAAALVRPLIGAGIAFMLGKRELAAFRRAVFLGRLRGVRRTGAGS